MAQSLQLERGFVAAMFLSLVAGVLTRFGVYSGIFYWVTLAALAGAVVVVVALILGQGGVRLSGNRHRRFIIGWSIAAVVAFCIWAAGEKWAQAALPFLNGSRKFWSAMNEFGLFFVIAFDLQWARTP